MPSFMMPKGVVHMRGMKLSLVLTSVVVVALAVWAGAYVQETGSHMAVAAERFLTSLSKDQLAKATYPFDAPERLDWHFIPRPRKGLPIKELSGEQRALAFGLIQSGTAATGFLKVTTIMSLEQILLELEKGSGPTRDPELYYLTVFGTPTNRGRWGWRVEGHHLSLNFVLEDGKIISGTPAFFGSNPGEVRQGPRQGLRTLADREDRALRLLQALDENQKKAVMFSHEAPKEIRAVSPPAPQPLTDPAVGVAYADMTGDQRSMLRAPVRVVCPGYDGRSRPCLARRDPRRRVREDQVHLGRPRRPQPAPRLPRPGPDLPHRVQQYPERRQPHPLRLAEYAGRFRDADCRALKTGGGRRGARKGGPRPASLRPAFTEN